MPATPCLSAALFASPRRAEVENGIVARLTVSDTGIGMDEATHRIFATVLHHQGIGAGTGLGLATVYGIVQTLEGDIRCRSTIGKGTPPRLIFRL